MSVAEKRGVALAGLAEGLSAREVARGLGISPGMVWRWAKLEGVKLQ
ncbi:helix-turn-helix domain-containing protein, partial [Tessaracoccus sp. MC1865]|nr:helix-turn-helix domain-containing protein [Tessaracoccus sp. MC1865]